MASAFWVDMEDVMVAPAAAGAVSSEVWLPKMKKFC